MKDRILEIIKREHLSNADFAEKIEVSPATISSIINGRNNPSLDVVTKIHKAYGNINLEWLLYGIGEMCNHKNDSSIPGLFDEITSNTAKSTDMRKYGREIASEVPENVPKDIVKQEVKFIEKPQRKITEIRIFFDDNTYETFRPEK